MAPDNMLQGARPAISGRPDRPQLRRKRPYAPSGRALALLVPLLSVACAGARREVPDPIPEGGTCDRAEQRLRELDCRQPSGAPWYLTPGGLRFSEACRDAMADGRDWNPERIAEIKSCDQVVCAYEGRCP